MPTPRIMYIERKTRNGVSLSDRGPAAIGEATFSKTGKTIYYQNLVLKSLGGQGIYGNYYDEATGDEFWVSGVKKDGSNRYPGFERHPVVENGSLA